MPSLPMPLRAALGLVATAVDEARHLPDRAIELPMLAVSTALQMSLRAQQRYAALAAKGDDVLARRETGDDPPAWATFDAPVTVAGPASGGANGRTADAQTDAQAVTKAGAGPTPPGTRPKTVRRPRNGKPSAFDSIGDE